MSILDRKHLIKHFGGLSELQNEILVHLKNENIEEIDENTFVGLKNLKALYLHNNKLRLIKANQFKETINLETLWLNNNQIEELDENAFVDLNNLKVLNLIGNKLKLIKANQFKETINLETLYLSCNQIKELDENAFVGLKNLKVLKLHNNKLKRIDRECFVPLKSIGLIELYLNEFNSKYICYLNKSLLTTYLTKYDIDINETLLFNSFESDWNRFLQQFPDKESEFSMKGKLVNKRYRIQEYLGRGGFGNVYLVLDEKEYNVEKVIKMIEKLDESKEPKNKEENLAAKNEVELLKRIKHEHVIKYFDNFDWNQVLFSNYLVIVAEFCEKGDLHKQIKKYIAQSRKIPDLKIAKWILDSTDGLKHLHANGIIHRDIKPENILVTKNDVVKLADLGLSKYVEDKVKVTLSKLAGTDPYFSPEQIACSKRKKSHYTNKIDIWSLGCVLYELVNLKRAFPDGQFSSNPIIPKLEKTKFQEILDK